MLCQSCGEPTATMRVKEIVNGRLTEYAICASCARRLGYNTLLSGLGRGYGSMLSEFFGDQPPEPEKRCPQCGASFEEIARTGRVGCALCYETFEEELMPLIQRLHGNELHCGKFPGENLPQPRLQSQMIPMREMLEKAIRAGNKNLLKGGESDA